MTEERSDGMTLRVTDSKIIKRAFMCMNVIKGHLKESHLSPKVIVNGLQDGTFSIGGNVLKSVGACMDVVKSKTKENGIPLAEMLKLYGVDAGTFKSWFVYGTLPYDVFIDLCARTHTKVDDVFDEAKDLVRSGKAREIPTPAIPSVEEYIAWFNGDMPFVWFLKSAIFAHIKAGDVFKEAKGMMRSGHAAPVASHPTGPTNATTPDMVQSTTVEPQPVEPPFDRTYVKDGNHADAAQATDGTAPTVGDGESDTNHEGPTQHVEPKSPVGVDPWAETFGSGSDAVNHDGQAQSHDTQQGQSSAEQQGSSGLPEEFTGLSGWEDDEGGDAEHPFRVSGTTGTQMTANHDAPLPPASSDNGGVTVDDTPESNGAKASSQSVGQLDGVIPGVEREIAPGVTESDLNSSLTDPPYEFNLAGAQAGVDEASQVMVNWPYLRSAALDAHDGIDKHSREDIERIYPAPKKVNKYVIGLKFNSVDDMNTFVDDGYMHDLQEVIDRQKLNVTLQQANFIVSQ